MLKKRDFCVLSNPVAGKTPDFWERLRANYVKIHDPGAGLGRGKPDVQIPAVSSHFRAPTGGTLRRTENGHFLTLFGHFCQHFSITARFAVFGRPAGS